MNSYDNSVKERSLPHDAVGRKFVTKVPILTSDQTIGEAQKLIQNNVKSFDTINYIYVLTKHGKLAGLLSIREVFAKLSATPLKEVMIKDLIVAHPKTDQQKVAQLAVKHNIKAIPIVDEYHNFLGVVDNDQILNILDQESEEDLLRLSGIILGKEHKEEESSLPVAKTFMHRIPWILIGLFGGLFTAKVISGYETVLEKNLVLASFIPLIAYIANAVGTQTQTLYIRDLAYNSHITFIKYAAKQTLTSILIAVSCWLVIFLISLVLFQSLTLGFVVGLAVFTAILMATFFALLIPYILQRYKIDPAIGSGPFTTIIQDLLSIVIYFAIASALL